jgi:peptide/nickel transport system permease protein
MIRYIFRRLFQAIPTFFGITILSYILMAASGNPVKVLAFRPNTSLEEQNRLAAQLGVNDPWHIQYIRWLAGDDWMRWDADGDGVSDRAVIIPLDADGDGEPEPPGRRRGVLRGDFGNSFTLKRPVLDILVERLPATLELSIASLVIGTGLGIIVGILAALNRGKWFDTSVRVVTAIFNALPNFWLGLMLLLLFSVTIRNPTNPREGLLPIGDRCETTIADSCPPIWERLEYMILPVSLLSFGLAAGIARFMRVSMLDIMGQDFIRTAQAKGLRSRIVWLVHAARNALIPIATFLGPAITGILGGAVITERIFNYQGVGLAVFSAATQRDYPVVMAVTIYAALSAILGYLLSDILYALIDPRIRFD